MMLKEIETRYEVEKLLVDEADFLDRWQLDAWLDMFDEECCYEVAPLGIGDADPDAMSADTVLFLISDDRWRLQQRVAMLKEPSAHIEWPHSKTRHIFGNLKILRESDDEIEAQINIVVYRTRRSVTTEYMGRAHYRFVRLADDRLKIRRKRVTLDLDGLVPQGKVSIIL